MFFVVLFIDHFYLDEILFFLVGISFFGLANYLSHLYI